MTGSSSEDDESHEETLDDIHQDTLINENESSDASSDESGGGGLLDTMAVEGSESDSDSSSDQGDYDYVSWKYSGDPFPQFSRLPLELRQRIWEIFCPDLNARRRVLDFGISFGTARYRDPSWPADARVWTVHDNIFLDDSTKALRTVLSVHQESRNMALNVFPHSLMMDAGPNGNASIQFNRDLDVISLSGFRELRGTHYFHLPNFSDQVKNLALSGWMSPDEIDGSAVSKLLGMFDKVESVFFGMPSTQINSAKLEWCFSGLINRYEGQLIESDEIGRREVIRNIWCWPDLRDHADYAKYQIPRGFLDDLPDPINTVLAERGARTWPMVTFERAPGMEEFEILSGGGAIPQDDSDESGLDDDDEESGTDLDEYESDGIDDEEVVDTYDSSYEGISLAGDSPNASPFAHAALDDDTAANFSSPEPEPMADTAPVARGRKRRVVSDSDDEDEEDTQPVAKRARTAEVISSDSEGDEPAQPVASQERVTRKARVVISDDEDDDEEEPVKLDKSASKDDSNGSSEVEEDDEESDEESDSQDSSEDEDQPPARMSLAERLRLHREENPVDQNDSDKDDESSRTADSEDEEDQSDGGARGNPFLMNMADESDGEGEGDYYDESE